MSDTPIAMLDLDDPGPPYVGAALICDQIIDAKDNTFSLIRLVDRMAAIVPWDAPETGTFKIPVEMKIFFQLREIEPEDLVELKGVTWGPTGERKDQGPFDLAIPPRSENRTYNLIFELTMHLDTSGRHAIGLVYRNRLLTRIPFSFHLERAQRPNSTELPAGDKSG